MSPSRRISSAWRSSTPKKQRGQVLSVTRGSKAARFFAGEDAGVVHHLAQADTVAVTQNFLNDLRAENRPGGLQMSCRHAGRGHEKQVEWQTPGAVQHVLYAFKSANISNFMKV